MNGAGETRQLGPLSWNPITMPLIMGIINITPDSFSDGGEFLAITKAMAHARKLFEQGADILDIGGESTRPGARLVEEEEELSRVIPVIEALAKAKLNCALSIDTYKARVAEKALEAGVHIVNDVWGLQKEPDIARIAAEHNAQVIISHWEKEGFETTDILEQLKAFFDRSLEIAHKAGLADHQIILDPGIGFGKSAEDNLCILNHLDEMVQWSYPLLVGVSRKRFIGSLLNKEPKDRLYGTLASNVIAYTKGASIFRVHDVEAHTDALIVARAIKEG